ncbi:MAG: hypothetical protein H0V17_22265 [Deltaproteobacteria bacterium]|nr:hypothetical protein [Deltaproteobacteria bacterium]
MSPRSGWLIVLAACGGSGSPSDAGSDAPADGAAATGEVVFLNFEGVDMTSGPDDATANTASVLLAGPTYTLSPYLSSNPDRDARIAGVTALVDEILVRFRISVVTTRPASGPYNMIVLTGMPGEAGYPVNTFGAAPKLCGDTSESPTVLIFGDTLLDPRDDVIASLSVAGLAVSQGIPSSNEANDCACWDGPSCVFDGSCSFGGLGTPIAPDEPCANGATVMSTLAQFTSVFGIDQ